MPTKASDSKDVVAQSGTRFNDSSSEVTPTAKMVTQSNDISIKHIAIILSLSFLLMFATSFGILAFATRGWLSNHSQPVVYTGYPPNVYGVTTAKGIPFNPSATSANTVTNPGYEYAPRVANTRSFSLDDVPNMALTQISRNQVVALQWGATGSGEEKKYLLYVEGVTRDVKSQTTTLLMSSGYSIVVHTDSAILFDRNNEELGTIEFSVEEQNEPSETEKENTNNSKLRKLVRYGKEKHGGGDFFDGYCRYGCSQMGVTFPYYYRPFFGYGYPLVGTEGMFPAGYGGNPVTELAANGVIGAPGAGGVPGMAPMAPPAGLAPGMTPGMAPF